MRVEPKAIVRRLNPTCTAMLESAVAHAASGRFYEIVPEHLLLALLASEDTDAAAILAHVHQDPRRLRERVGRVCELMRSGNAGRPVFAENLFQWLEDSWVFASLQFGAGEIRSGHLLLMFANSHTTKVDSFDYIQNRRNPDLSWSDTRETVDSAATVRALLADNEGVLFAHTSWRYYSIPE